MADDHAVAVSALASVVHDRLLHHRFEHHAQLLASLGAAKVVPALDVPAGLPVLGHLGAAIDLVDAEFADVVRALAPRAPWTRTAAYVRDPPSPAFLDGYAHATLAGAPDDADTAARHGVSLGLLLLGPEIHYPAHHHPADEIYVPLTAALWLDSSDESYRPQTVGTPLRHRPWQPHGMWTGSRPLLAIYVWSGDVVSPSRFC